MAQLDMKKVDEIGRDAALVELFDALLEARNKLARIGYGPMNDFAKWTAGRKGMDKADRVLKKYHD